MKLMAYALFAVSFAMMYVLHEDRNSTLGVLLVEWQTMLHAPPYTVAALFGGVLLVMSRRGQKRSKRVRPQSRPSTPPKSSAASPHSTTGRAAETFDPDRDWLEQVREAAKAIRWPSGARLNIDPSKPCPIELSLEQAPPERAKRAMSLLGNWLASIPTPPRARIVFKNCPEGGSPRHHQASGSLAESIHRGQFKALSDLDAVDVMFHHPDPRWTALR